MDSLQPPPPWGTVRPNPGARTQMSGQQQVLRDVAVPPRLLLGHTRPCGPSGNRWSCQTSTKYWRWPVEQKMHFWAVQANAQQMLLLQRAKRLTSQNLPPMLRPYEDQITTSPPVNSLFLPHTYHFHLTRPSRGSHRRPMQDPEGCEGTGPGQGGRRGCHRSAKQI